MGVVTDSQVIKSVVAPSRLFKAMFLDSHILCKMVPQRIKNVELVEGDGGVGSIMKINFGESSNITYAKYKINTINKNRLFCKYTMIESDIMFDKIEKVVKFVKTAGRFICKMSIEYHVEEHCDLKQADIGRIKDTDKGLFKAVEEFLLANPHVCA